MKKFYATLTAVALGCAAIVAAPLGGKQSIKANGMNYRANQTCEMLNKATTFHSNVLNKDITPGFAQSRADEEMPNVSGTHLVVYENGASTVELIQNDSIVTFHEFVFTDAIDFEGTMCYDEEYAMWYISVPGNGQTILATYDTVDYVLYLCDATNLYTNDLTFYIHEIAPGQYDMFLPYQDCGIFFGYYNEEEKQFYGGDMMNIDILPLNCQTTSYWYDLENMAADPKQDVQPGFAFVDYLDEEGTYKGLYVFNFCGLPEPAVFLIDEANKAVVDAGAPVFTSGDIDFFMYPLNDDGSDIDIDGYVMGNYAINGNTTTVTFDQIIAVYGEDAGVAGLFGSVEMVLDFSIEAAGGVSDIVANANKDTRIFNVMGVQVDENYKGIVISNGKKYIQR